MSQPAIDISSLSPTERFELIDQLWASLEPGDWELSPEQSTELKRRLDRLDREGSKGISLQEMMARLETRHG